MKKLLLIPLTFTLSLQVSAEEAKPEVAATEQAVPQISPEEQAKTAIKEQLKKADQELKRGKNNKANLTKIRAEYDSIFANTLFTTALTKKEQANAYGSVAKLMLRMGDLQKNKDKQIASYSAGEAYAQKGMKIAPNQPRAPFYNIVNSAKRSKAQGLFKSATQIGTVFKESRKMVKKHPKYFHIYNALGQFYYKAPGLLGGSDSKAEETFKTVIKMKPQYTAARVSYAEFLAKEGEDEKAKKLFEEVLAEKKPTVYWDWLKFDKPKAERGLKNLK